MKLTPLRTLVMIIIVVAVALLVILRGGRRPRDSDLGPAWKYDLGPYRKTDPSLIIYNEVARMETGFRKPRGIAVGPDDRLYVAGDRSVRIFDLAAPVTLGPGELALLSGIHKAEIAVGGPPQCVAVAADGTIYAGLTDHVEVYQPGGARKAAWDSLGEKAVLTSIAVAGNDVLLADAGNRVVLRCDTSGAILARIGEEDDERNIPGLVIPSAHLDVAVAADGLLRVSNPGTRRIEAYTRDGDLELWWGISSIGLEQSREIEGFCGCCNPTDFALLSDGTVVTSEKGLPRVKLYEDITGRFIGVVAGPEAFAEATAYGFGEGFVGFDLATDSTDRVLVLDPATRTVRVFVRKPGAEAPAGQPPVERRSRFRFWGE